ncbi:unnamed protein product [Acanthoscelides obtectus]|uniref:Uncharacterized protein n=1 Tax=Acanthoscelides obtectus TaxID=200917 RepID=A0A9P0LMX8_ACAOB|nr:unnamed protein product [Acanthoscelides obtectus]CAK1668222.1 hypothetical protein AOBTE_LOCUS26289 [Acanthoscelides obtectus]
MAAKLSRMSRMIVDREPASHQTTFTLLYIDFLGTQRSINAAYYSNLLKTDVKPAYPSERRSIFFQMLKAQDYKEPPNEGDVG